MCEVKFQCYLFAVAVDLTSLSFASVFFVFFCCVDFFVAFVSTRSANNEMSQFLTLIRTWSVLISNVSRFYRALVCHKKKSRNVPILSPFLGRQEINSLGNLDVNVFFAFFWRPLAVLALLPSVCFSHTEQICFFFFLRHCARVEQQQFKKKNRESSFSLPLEYTRDVAGNRIVWGWWWL